jgi:hypothetical protein
VNLTDVFDAFNWMDRLEGLISSLIFADWKGATSTNGPLGLVGEAGRTLMGANAWTFHIQRNGGWTGGDAERLLKHYGVRLWCRRVTSKHFILSVEERQANWAEYLLLRRGIPLEGRLFNPDNQRYALRYAPGDQPPAWADRGREPPAITGGTREELGEPEPRDIVDRLGDLL